MPDREQGGKEGIVGRRACVYVCLCVSEHAAAEPRPDKVSRSSLSHFCQGTHTLMPAGALRESSSIAGALPCTPHTQSSLAFYSPPSVNHLPKNSHSSPNLPTHTQRRQAPPATSHHPSPKEREHRGQGCPNSRRRRGHRRRPPQPAAPAAPAAPVPGYQSHCRGESRRWCRQPERSSQGDGCCYCGGVGLCDCGE